MIDFVRERAVIEVAQRKRVKYEAKCADLGYGFLPFLFFSFGELEKDAVILLKRIRRFSVTQDVGARKDIAKITKKWPKPDKNEHEIMKSAQKPNPKTFQVKPKITKA
nr:hypothetical protein [Tanacetum cinerariifolium]